MIKGSCLCGAVQFQVSGDLPAADACHCAACRKSSGHFFVSADIKRDQLQITRDDGLRWFQSSAKVRRGFCGICGSSLFFDPVIATDWTAVAMGALSPPTGGAIEKHIFVADKGDYYDLTYGLPQEMEPPG